MCFNIVCAFSGCNNKSNDSDSRAISLDSAISTTKVAGGLSQAVYQAEQEFGKTSMVQTKTFNQVFVQINLARDDVLKYYSENPNADSGEKDYYLDVLNRVEKLCTDVQSSSVKPEDAEENLSALLQVLNSAEEAKNAVEVNLSGAETTAGVSETSPVETTTGVSETTTTAPITTTAPKATQAPAPKAVTTAKPAPAKPATTTAKPAVTTAKPVVTTAKPTTTAPKTTTAKPTTTTTKVDTSKWLSGVEHKPLRVNVKPNQLYWGTTSMAQMNNISKELDFVFNNRTAYGAGTNCTVIEFYYNVDKSKASDYIKNPQKIPSSYYTPSKENFKFWLQMSGYLEEYYGFGSSDGGMNDNAYIAYSTYIDPTFRTGANKNGDCGGRAQFTRSFLNYMGYETRYVTGQQYGGGHAGYQVRLPDGLIGTGDISEENITNYGPWE